MPEPHRERAEVIHLAKRDADQAVAYFTRLHRSGLSRSEALDLTAAWVMRNAAERDEREEWERG